LRSPISAVDAFMAEGWVADASSDCANLIGHSYYEFLVTTDPFVAETDRAGKVFIAPP